MRTRKVKCPFCHNDNVVKNGNSANDKQIYRCTDCSKRFLHTGQVAGHRKTAEQISAAVRMYYGGTSYKQTS
ncbi:MAG: IS1 family transposase [Chloroflexi bacterium]|nr:IS1 family transposase [Chloroflexota bacterium]